MKKTFICLFIALLIPVFAYSADYEVGDRGQLGDSWRVRSNGDILPKTDSSQDIGASGDEVAKIYVDELFVGGAKPVVQFTPGDFVIQSSSERAIDIDIDSSPGYETDNAIPSIVWADGETSKIMVTFRVPPGYSSSGAFRAFCDQSAYTSTHCQVDFEVYVNSDGSSFDSSATDQTAVALTKDNGTPELVTLTPATDFSSLSAGDVVTIKLWRNDTYPSDSTGDLELYYVEFYYQ